MTNLDCFVCWHGTKLNNQLIESEIDRGVSPELKLKGSDSTAPGGSQRNTILEKRT